MKHSITLLLILLMIAAGCRQRRPFQAAPKADTTRPVTDADRPTQPALVLAGLLKNSVDFDSLVDAITHQEQVKVVARLSEKWDADHAFFKYSDSNYHFVIRPRDRASGMTCTPADFFDGGRKIRFSDYPPLCTGDSGFQCETYGFNCSNTLRDPVVIELLGKRYLYSDVSFNCNGVGCSCRITFIYDLQTKRLVFLENFDIDTGFLLSDFDNDGAPDLLVISETQYRIMEGFDAEEFDVRLTAYDWNGGLPKRKKPGPDGKSSSLDLYTIMASANHGFRSGRRYTLRNDEWVPLRISAQ